jgi:hypothetical protein
VIDRFVDISVIVVHDCYTVCLKYVFIAHFFVIFTEAAACTASSDDKDARATQEDKT